MVKIIHRISISSSPQIQAELAIIGVAVAASGFVNFSIEESAACWPQAQKWIEMRGALDFVITKFSEREISRASWLELSPDWHCGYPQPDELKFGYLAATYDLTDYCQECGAGLKQSAPFQMKNEPNWGRNEILQLNWVFDEYFVTPELWIRAFKPHGVGCQEVLGRNGCRLATVVQLVVNDYVDLVTEGLAFERCIQCKRIKFTPQTQGYFPQFSSEPEAHMVKTFQYFGSGKSASRRNLVSSDLSKILTKVHGASMRPVLGR